MASAGGVAEAKRLGEALSRWARGGLAAGDLDAACARLGDLAGHADHLVRYAVVVAAAGAPDACFDAVVPRLAKDPRVSVARAAKSALADRTAKRKAIAALDEKSADIASLENKIEERGGKAALRDALTLADAREDQLARKLRHEFKKNVAAFKLSLAALEAEWQRKGPARVHNLGERATTSAP